MTTDQADYAPGEVVTITGVGFAPDEIVALVLVDDPLVDGPRTWEVLADGSGGFVDQSFTPQEQHIGVTFTLTATGQESGRVAQTSFTDGTVALGSNLPTNINVAWRRFGNGFTPGNTTCTGSPGLTGTALNVNSTSSVALGSGVNTLQSVELTAPAVTGYAFQGWSIAPSTTIVSTNAVHCFAGVTPTIKYQLNYVPGPTKLAFITGPFTGQVGDCLGPMTVQSQNASNNALAVLANTTVGLLTDNGGTGAGTFFSDSSCSTGITSVQINSGSTDSSDFYYRATGRGDGTHQLTADDTSPNTLTSATRTQTINKALTTLTYIGDRIVLVGNTLTMKAVLESDFEGCISGKTILWYMEPDPADSDPYVFFPSSTTNSSGVAMRSLTTTGWEEGIYDGRTSFPGDANCEASKDDPAITVLLPGNAAIGGGFLAGNKVGGGRVNFGFNVRPIEGSDPIAYKGQFLLIKKEGDPVFRCKGELDTYGVIPNSDLNVASGTCDFQVWNPTLNGGTGGWEVPYGYEDRPFTIYFKDFGSGKGKYAPPPDELGFTIDYVGAVADPSFDIAPINGGNIDVKDETGSSSPADGGTSGPSKGKGRK